MKLATGGSHNFNNKNSTPENIVNKIVDMAILSCGYGVNNIFISVMICRRSRFLSEKVKCINFFYWNLSVKKINTL